MRILLISQSDISGGANISAFRLHQALRSVGIDSILLVLNKFSEDKHVIRVPDAAIGPIHRGRGTLDSIPRSLIKEDALFSTGIVSINLNRLIKTFNPDILHLHWTNSGTLGIEALREVSIPVVWTLHDMWPFTGGCHYSKGCTLFETECRNCPQIAQFPFFDFANWVFKRKMRHWTNTRFSIIAPSNWMANWARKSRLFGKCNVYNIPYTIKTDDFDPCLRQELRHSLAVSDFEKVILFVQADQKRKGAAFIPELLKFLLPYHPTHHFRCLFVGGAPPGLDDLSLPYNFIERATSSTMPGYYFASDVFVLPTIEDNLPNTVIESLCAGTPVVSFPVGGIPDMIEAGTNGYLSDANDAKSTGQSIIKALSMDIVTREKIRKDAIFKYSHAQIAKKHLEAYESALHMN